jgi:hypothetical protein
VLLRSEAKDVFIDFFAALQLVVVEDSLAG